MINKEIKTRITLTLTHEVKAKLEVAANNDNRTVSNLINKLISDYLDKTAK